VKFPSVPSTGLPGLTLRPISLADVDPWYEYLSKPEVVEHTSWNLSGPGDLIEMAQWYLSEEPGTAIRFALIELQGNSLVGTFGYHSICVPHQTAELAFDLNPRFWNRGIASSVCRSITVWGFNVKEFVRIQATALETNRRSQRVLQKCGFEFEGRLRSYRMISGRPGDFFMYSLLATRRELPGGTSGDEDAASG
jgi:ribosomal-protein-alanine N-acetyltransferase